MLMHVFRIALRASHDRQNIPNLSAHTHIEWSFRLWLLFGVRKHSNLF